MHATIHGKNQIGILKTVIGKVPGKLWKCRFLKLNFNVPHYSETLYWGEWNIKLGVAPGYKLHTGFYLKSWKWLPKSLCCKRFWGFSVLCMK
jgi:hypothetical protein